MEPLAHSDPVRLIVSAFGLALCLVLPLPSSAGDPVTSAARQLAERLEPIETMSAEFQQTVFGARYQVLQEATGRLWLARPLRFRWEVDQPYEQLVVTDDARLYVYDPDLEQVNIEPLDEALRGTPALILAGSLEDIENEFHVTVVDRNHVEVYQLTPRSPDSLYSRLRLRFEGERLAGLEIDDALEQRTEVVLSNVAVNVPVEESHFSFEVPPGTDVIGDVGLAP
jgi:outer membrane lipoprotein carrier protein